MFFPAFAKSPYDTDQAGHLKKRSLLLLDGIIKGNADARQTDIEKIDAYLLSMHRPQRFDGSDGLEVRMKRGFDETCLSLQTHGITNPKNLSLREFYGAIEMMKKKK